MQKPQLLEDATLDLGGNLRPAPVRGGHWNGDLELAPKIPVGGPCPSTGRFQLVRPIPNRDEPGCWSYRYALGGCTGIREPGTPI